MNRYTKTRLLIAIVTLQATQLSATAQDIAGMLVGAAGASEVERAVGYVASNVTDGVLNRVCPHRLAGIALFEKDRDGNPSLAELIPQKTEAELRCIIKQRLDNAKKRIPCATHNPRAFLNYFWNHPKEVLLRTVIKDKGFEQHAVLAVDGMPLLTKDGKQFLIPYLKPSSPFHKGSKFNQRTMPFVKVGIVVAGALVGNRYFNRMLGRNTNSPAPAAQPQTIASAVQLLKTNGFQFVANEQKRSTN